MFRGKWPLGLIPCIAASCLIMLAGCAAFRVSETLPRAITGQADVETARQALPSYLVLCDALILADERDIGALSSGARLYTLYSLLIEPGGERGQPLSDRAFGYGSAALCLRSGSMCGYSEMRTGAAGAALEGLKTGDLPAAGAFVSAWLLWLQTRSDDPAVLAKLPRVEMLLERMLKLDESFDNGSSHFYLAILKTLRPPALGGDAASAKAHFERALNLTQGKNLSIKVEYAGRYARMLYDRDLHDRLLREVLAAPTEAGEFTLFNALAKARAKKLLETAEEYF